MADPLPLTGHLAASDEPELVRTPAVRYVAVLGTGSPGTDEFYRKKTFVADVARTLAPDAATPVIEIQYWYPEGSVPVGHRGLLQREPDPVAAVPDHGRRRRRHHRRRRSSRPRHRGPGDAPRPFADEFGTLERLGAFADGAGVARSGPHHEIHLDAFTRQTPQDALRTILRDPVA